MLWGIWKLAFLTVKFSLKETTKNSLYIHFNGAVLASFKSHCSGGGKNIKCVDIYYDIYGNHDIHVMNELSKETTNIWEWNNRCNNTICQQSYQALIINILL